MESIAEIDKEIERHEKELKRLRQTRDMIRGNKSKQSSNQYKKRKAILEETGKFLEGKLFPGMIVKVMGSRAGPYRQIIYANGFEIYGNHLRYKERDNSFQNMYSPTSHMLSKITHMWMPDEEKFMKIEDWVAHYAKV